MLALTGKTTTRPKKKASRAMPISWPKLQCSKTDKPRWWAVFGQAGTFSPTRLSFGGLVIIKFFAFRPYDRTGRVMP
jgi:hypothetical protein